MHKHVNFVHNIQFMKDEHSCLRTCTESDNVMIINCELVALKKAITQQ